MTDKLTIKDRLDSWFGDKTIKEKLDDFTGVDETTKKRTFFAS